MYFEHLLTAAFIVPHKIKLIVEVYLNQNKIAQQLCRKTFCVLIPQYKLKLQKYMKYHRKIFKTFTVYFSRTKPLLDTSARENLYWILQQEIEETTEQFLSGWVFVAQPTK